MLSEVKTRAIVVKSQPYGESDLIITFLSEDLGIIKGIAKGALTSRKRFAGCFEPFTLIMLGGKVRESGGLFRVDTADILKPYYGIREELARLEAGARVLELAAEVEVHGREAVEVFGLLEKTLRLLEGSSDAMALSGAFFVKYLGISGFKPPWDACVKCGKDLTDKGAMYQGGYGLLCGGCGTGGKALKLSPGCLAFLRRCEVMDVTGMGRLRLSPGARAEVFRFLACFIGSVVGKSLKTLDKSLDMRGIF